MRHDAVGIRAGRIIAHSDKKMNPFEKSGWQLRAPESILDSITLTYHTKRITYERQILLSNNKACSADRYSEPAQRRRQFSGRRHAQLCGAVLDLGRVACIQLCKRSLYGLLRAGHRRHDIERTILGPEGSAGNSGDRRDRAALFPADRAGFLWLRPADTG